MAAVMAQVAVGCHFGTFEYGLLPRTGQQTI
jgi:hypothetical protein